MRERLSNRRKCLSTEFRHWRPRFTLATGYFADGRLAEIFLSSNQVGPSIEAMARDCAILVSIALQRGAHIETLRHALTCDHDGGPATAIGAALDQLCKE
jgi:hypothetical protein